MSKISDHFDRHHKTYKVLGVGVLIGVTTTLIITKTQTGNTAVQKVVAFRTGDITQNVIQQLSRRGHPGIVVRCNETGEIFASIKRASELLELDRTALTRHLQGLKDSVGGFTFEVLGEATK